MTMSAHSLSETKAYCVVGKKLLSHLPPPKKNKQKTNPAEMNNSAEGGLTKFWELFTIIPCALRDFKTLNNLGT